MHLFDTTPKNGETKLRDLYRNRVFDIALSPTQSVTSFSSSADSPDTSPLPTLASEVTSPRPAIEERVIEPPDSKLAQDPSVAAHDSSAEVQRLSERMTRSLVDALTGAMAVFERQAARDQDKLKDALAEAARVSGQLTEMGREVAALHQRIEGKAQATDALASRLTDVESHLAASGDGLHVVEQQLQEERDWSQKQWTDNAARMDRISERLDEVVHSLEMQAEITSGLSTAVSSLQAGQDAAQRRLNLQAEAIRTLHAASAKQAGQWEQCLLSVQQAVRAACPPPGPTTLSEQL